MRVTSIMPPKRGLPVTLLLSVLFWCVRLLGQEEPITLASQQGASITFNESGGTWRWVSLITPDAPMGGWSLSDRPVSIATRDQEVMLAPGWTLIEATAERVLLEQ